MPPSPTVGPGFSPGPPAAGCRPGRGLTGACARITAGSEFHRVPPARGGLQSQSRTLPLPPSGDVGHTRPAGGIRRPGPRQSVGERRVDSAVRPCRRRGGRGWCGGSPTAPACRRRRCCRSSASATRCCPGPTSPWIPDIILTFVLPPLLYSAALDSSLLAIRRNLRTVVSLSVVLVLLTALVIGFGFAWFVAGATLAAGIAVGAAVAPPDPVAALAVGRKVGLPPRLLTIIQGEGLLNDATALTILERRRRGGHRRRLLGPVRVRPVPGRGRRRGRRGRAGRVRRPRCCRGRSAATR